MPRLIRKRHAWLPLVTDPARRSPEPDWRPRYESASHSGADSLWRESDVAFPGLDDGSRVPGGPPAAICFMSCSTCATVEGSASEARVSNKGTT